MKKNSDLIKTVNISSDVLSLTEAILKKDTQLTGEIAMRMACTAISIAANNGYFDCVSDSLGDNLALSLLLKERLNNIG